MANQDNSWLKQPPYDRFPYFIAAKVDRYKTLIQTIEKLGLYSAVISVSGNKHIFIFPPNHKKSRPGGGFPFMGQSPIMLVAHYDRVAGSLGANDNSIAVFHLLKAAMVMAAQFIDNWIIVFTDKEEISSGESLDSQGSFTLAQKLKTWGYEKARIFNFDSCGTGDTFIFSTLTDSILGNNGNPNIVKVKDELQRLRSHVLQIANILRLEKMLLAPAPFCDDVGFLRAGFAVQTITMLPSEEAAQFEDVLRKNPDFSRLLITGEIKTSPDRRFLPATWKNINTPADTPDRLTPQFFDLVVNFIVELCR